MVKNRRHKDPPETDLLEPVLSLFPHHEFYRATEVPLGWRRIDLISIHRKTNSWTAVELKIRDWRGALCQAVTNRQLVDKSYVAMWHRHVPNALRNRVLFERFRIGIIEVGADSANVLADYEASTPTQLMCRQREIVTAALNGAETGKNADEAISLLPA